MEYSFTLCGLGIRKGAQRGTDVLIGALGMHPDSMIQR